MESYRDPNQQQPQQQPLFQLNFEPQNAYMLRGSASWARILGVVGIIFGVILIAIFAITLSEASKPEYRSASGRMFDDKDDLVLGCVLFIVAGLIFIIGGLFAFRFGKKISSSLAANSQEGLNNAFLQLRNYFALRSITVILVLVLLVLGMIGASSDY